MARNRYRDLLIWQKSVLLIKEIYAEAEKLPKSEEYNLKQQLKRAIVSVSLNIAEGKNRRTAKDFINFLNIAKGSLAETEAVLLICEELQYLHVSEGLFMRIEELAKMINGLITSIRKKNESF
ncbi:MAG: four helix bundle protein [Syntrophaceae bacterium]|nr:four helix bundle protein [Syntrophaceae bacterium]